MAAGKRQSVKTSFARSVARGLLNACGARDVDGVGRVGVALSGGADSVALLAALTAEGFDCVALHCNFNLRGDESRGDEQFCRDLARGLGVVIEVVQFDVAAAAQKGESLEMACRRLRYDYFEDIAKRLGLSHILLGHHLEDNVETLMLNLLRGSGPKGLRGMEPVRGIYVRPMLSLTRADIIDYLNGRGLGFRTDSSNLSNDYRRNALRNTILPVIGSYFPAATEGMLNTMRAMGHTCAVVDNFVDWAIERFADPARRTVDVDALAGGVTDPASTLYLIARRFWPGGCSMSTVGEILASRRSGSRFATEEGLPLELSRRRLREAVAATTDAAAADTPADLPGLTLRRLTPEEFRSAPHTPDVACFDAAMLDTPAVYQLRGWQTGDRFTPFGMKGSRLLSDLFSDLKLSRAEKASVKILTRDGEILWVVGLRRAAAWPVTEQTAAVAAISPADAK